MNHPDPKLQTAWKLTQLGLLIFPLLPTWGALTLLLATIITWKQNFRQIIRQPLNIGLAILSIWLIVIALFAADKKEAFLGLANFLPFFLQFAAARTLIQTSNQLRRLSWIIAIASIPVLILGCGQQFFGWSTIPQLQIFFGWILEPQGNPPGRMASVFMYANILAIYLVIVSILTGGLWLEKLQLIQLKNSNFYRDDLAAEKTKTPDYRTIFNPQFLFLTLIILSSVIALIFTNSRNGWGLAILASIAYSIYLSWHWLTGIVVATVASIFGAAFGSSPWREWLRGIVPTYFWSRLADYNFPDRAIATLRITQWQFAWRLTRERPITGWGLRNFTPLYQAKMNLWLGHPHNLLLMLTCETGLPATLFLCAWVGWIFARGVLLLVKWPSSINKGEENYSQFDLPHSGDRLIFFSYLVAFAACTLFNMFDVTLFDLRINTLGWLLLAAICGRATEVRRMTSDHSPTTAPEAR